MESGYMLETHTRSMSSLASTILKLPSENPILTPTPDRAMDTNDQPEIPLELRMPLPPSRACSEDGREEVGSALVESVAEAPVKGTRHNIEQEPSIILSTTGNEDPDCSPQEQPLPAAAPVNLSSLNRLHSLVASAKAYDDRVRLLKLRLEDLRLRCGLERRLLDTFAHAHRLMAFQFRNTDQPGFVRSYDVCEELTRYIGAMYRPVEGEPYSDGSVDPDERFMSTWTDFLSPLQRESLLAFLTQIRCDPGYLATCLCKLSSAELSALTSSYRFESPICSVLPGSRSGKGYGHSRGLPKNMNGPMVEQVQGFFQDDPLFTILHGIFDESPGQGYWEYCQRIDVLSTACAKIMVGGKRGSDDLASAMLDSFASLRSMSAKPKLEAYLLKVLHDGTSILEMPLDHFGNSSQPVEIRNANVVIAKSNFFEKCSADFFSLLVEELPQILPAVAIRFIQAVLRKIEDPLVRNRAKNFIVSRWFFCSFISNILIQPESCGMMMRHHIGETARQGLLKELAVRLQKQVYDVVTPWNRHSLVDAKIGSMIERIFSYFEPAKLAITPRPSDSHHSGDGPSAATASIMLSPHIASSLIRTLLPPAAQSPISTDLPYVENKSTASSIAASSTLTSGSLGFGSAVPSSLAPSISGTSMTSTTMLSDFPLVEPQSGYDQGNDGTANLYPETGSSTKGVGGGLSGSSIEICQSLSATLDSQRDCLLDTHANNWAFIDITGKGSRLSLAPSESQGLGTRTPSDGPQDMETISGGLHYDEFGDAISRAIIRTESWAESWFQDEISMRGGVETLSSLLRSAMTECESGFDYSGAHFWWRNIQSLTELSEPEAPKNALGDLIDRIAEKKSAAIEIYAESVSLLERKVHRLEMLAANQKQQLHAMGNLRKALRDKLWYTSDVKNSAIYEDALNVTHALRVMADSKRTSKKQSATSGWAKQRLRIPNMHDRSAAHALEALASPKEYGGLTKLADSQVELTTRWMTKNSIENFCKGEEMVHRFCYEIQRCVHRLAGVDMLDSPVLWSSDLFKHEKAMFNSRRTKPSAIHEASNSWDSRLRTPSITSPAYSTVLPTLSSTPVVPRSLAERTPMSITGFWQSTKPASQVTGTIPYLKQPQHDTVKSPVPAIPAHSTKFFNRSATQQLPIPPRHESHSGIATKEVSKAHRAFANHIENTVTALLLSDFGYILWSGGTETDNWINEHDLSDSTENQSVPQATQDITEPLSMESNSALSDALSDSTITVTQHENSGDGASPQAAQIYELPAREPSAKKSKSKPKEDPFRFPDAFERIIQKFSSSFDPSGKLDLLAELCSLVNISIDSANRSRHLGHDAGLRGGLPSSNPLSSRSMNIPRTKATSLEEIMANCTERRAGTLKYTAPKSPSRKSPAPVFEPSDTDATVNALLDIFRNNNLRPRTLYRDLQFIAAFIPPSTLDRSAKGKAFWDVGLAALAYKEDCCTAMIRRANQITNYHVSAHKDTASFTAAYSPSLISTSLGDAAQLWVTIAKEGSPVACRELGLFYLTHPELLPRVTLPFSKSKDVFRSVAAGDRTSVETGGLDPLTFAVVFHWMEVAASGGDKDARDFIRGNGELSAAR